MRLVLFALWLALSPVCITGQGSDRAQKSASAAELDALIASYVEPYCVPIKGDEKAFTHAVLPYGPLDLQVERAKSLDETRSWKGFYLGVVSTAAQIDVSTLAPPFRFECGPNCEEYRTSDLSRKLPEISELARDFYSITQLRLIANWEIKNEYRVNNMFQLRGRTSEALPSPIMGFVPSGKWRELKGSGQYLAEIGVSQTKFNSLLTRMQELSLAAIVRDPEGYIKIVKAGRGNDESGLIFHQNFFRKPTTGPMRISGRFDNQYPALLVVEPGIIYYEKHG